MALGRLATGVSQNLARAIHQAGRAVGDGAFGMGLEGGNLIPELIRQQPIIAIEVLDIHAPGLEPAPFPGCARTGIGLMDHLNPLGILAPEAFQHRSCVIRGAIIHQQHLQVAVALMEHTLHRRDHQFRAIMNRNNGADQG
jgi:hypothetical protein